MKNLINFAGGRGYRVDDVEVLQQQLNAIQTGIFEGNFVVSGCQVSFGPPISVSPGLVEVGGQLAEFAGATNVVLPAVFVLDSPATAADAEFSGSYPTAYFDLDDTVRPLYQRRNAVLVPTPSPEPGSVSISASGFTRTIRQWMAELLVNDFATPASEDWITSSPAGGTLRLRRGNDGFVHYDGQFPIAVNGQAIFPVGFRPAVLRNTDAIGYLANNTAVLAGLEITTAGVVNFGFTPETTRVTIRGSFRRF